jgi:hypothetical protein
MQRRFVFLRAAGSPLICLFLLFGLLLDPTPAHAQGCTQCRDNTAATSPATQRAYRHAIVLLGSAAATLFAATLLLFKRNP